MTSDNYLLLISLPFFIATGVLLVRSTFRRRRNDEPVVAIEDSVPVPAEKSNKEVSDFEDPVKVNSGRLFRLKHRCRPPSEDQVGDLDIQKDDEWQCDTCQTNYVWVGYRWDEIELPCDE